MFKIDWHQLEKNADDSSQDFFEKFIYQIARKRYHSMGIFNYFYNTPGSEYYLTLSKDANIEGVKLQQGDVVGWQAKFWLNKSDLDNSSLDSGHREELIKGFKKSLEYEPNLKVWIICTPGLFSNTKTKSVKPFEELEKELKSIKPDLIISLWNKPSLESLAHDEPDKYGSIFNHYCSTNFLSFSVFQDHSEKRLDILEKRYDTDLYTSGKTDKSILSSILYSELLDKLHNKIKHSLEDREKLNASYLYREVIDKFVNSKGTPEVSEDEKKRIYKLKELIDSFLSLHHKLHVHNEQDNNLELVKTLYEIMESDRDAIEDLMEDAGIVDSDSYETDVDIDSDIENAHHLIDNLYIVAENWLEKTVQIYRLATHLLRKVFHVFGDAGFGKTNCACYVTEQMLTKQLPVILIPASEIRPPSESIQKQIISFLGLDDSITFDKFVGILDSIGFHYNFKVPIIIDGLNETRPSASVWYPSIEYIIKDIEKYNNVMLITTCRNAYTTQVFDKENVDDIDNAISIKGFDENIEEAIKKYFIKYKITVLNEDYDRELFNHPLQLSIFSKVNENKSLEINESSIYLSVDSYIKTIIAKVSNVDGREDPIKIRKAKIGIHKYSKNLWQNNLRGIEYKDGIGLLEIFDPDIGDGDFHGSLSYKLFDEGFLFNTIQDNSEVTVFTHDLIGGYCIANSLFFEGNNQENIIKALTEEETILKLTADDTNQRHPLAEDILKAMVYLAPTKTGKHLFELIDNVEVTKASLQALRIVISNDTGIEALIRCFNALPLDSPILPDLYNSLIDEMLRHENNIILAELLEALIMKSSTVQIDLTWNEVIRRKTNQINPYLFRIIKTYESGNEGIDNIEWNICFIDLLLSTTNRYMRDMATKALVVIGRKVPEKLFEVYLRLEKTNDIHMLERLIASLCGALLYSENKELLHLVCSYLEKTYIENIATSHVLILDYVITLLDYAAKKHSFERSVIRLKEDSLIEWQKDPECEKKIDGDGKATWGYGPVGYDFAKYKIGSYLAQYRHKKDSKLPTLKEALALVVWRVKELGYTEELFEEVEQALRKQENKRYGYNSGYGSTSYRKKYRDISFYELYGHNIIKEISPDFKDEYGFRVDPYYIDATFPSLSSKRQLITCCLLPRHRDKVQDWINVDNPSFMEEHYVRTDIERDGSEWVMLYGHLVQEGGDEKSRIDISLYTMMVPEEKADRVVEMIQENKIHIHFFAVENSNVLAGEIPWSDNYLDGIRYEYVDGDKTAIYFPVSSYFQQTKSGIDIVSQAYVPSKGLAESLGLKINLKNINLVTSAGELASSYIHDNHSSFIYFRKDLLEKFFEETKQSLIWIEWVYKNGAFGEHKSKYQPSLKELRFVSKFDV